MRRVAVTLLIAMAAPGPSATPIAAQPSSGGFVVTLGADTVQVERFTRRDSVLEGVVVTRTPTTRILSYRLALGRDARPLRYEAEARRPDGTPLTVPGITGSFVYANDTIVREARRDGAPVTSRIAAARGTLPGAPIPYLGVPYALYELAHRYAREAGGGSTESAWHMLTMLPGQTQPQRQRVWFVGADSIEADYFGVARSGYRFSADGQLLRSDWTGTTFKYRGVRVGGVDVEAVARRWAELETTGSGFGVLSPRDTTRGRVGRAELRVDYSRPGARGRAIWGTLVPWDTIWRLGADMATHFTTSADVVIGGVHVPAGTYTLWLLPSARGPTSLVVNTRIGIFGTGYTEASDFARIPVTRSPAGSRAERLTIALASDRIDISWDDVTWSAPMAEATPSRASLAAAERAASEQSVFRGLRAAWGARLAEDGALLVPGAPVVHGREAAVELLAAQRALDSVTVRWNPLAMELSSDGRMGATYGVVATVPRGAPNVAPRFGNFAHVWSWIDGAGWRLVAAMQSGVTLPASAVIPASIAVELPSIPAAGPGAAFVAADRAFTALAASADPGTAFRTYAADDAVLFTGANELLRGPAAIGQAFAGAPPVDWTWFPVVAGGSPDGTLGFTVGQSTSRPRGDTAAQARLSKYLTIWRREASGSARYVFDGGNARPAPGAR